MVGLYQTTSGIIRTFKAELISRWLEGVPWSPWKGQEEGQEDLSRHASRQGGLRVSEVVWYRPTRLH
jgi:hypothetical protein